MQSGRVHGRSRIPNNIGMFHEDEGSALNVDGTAPWDIRGDSSDVCQQRTFRRQEVRKPKNGPSS